MKCLSVSRVGSDINPQVGMRTERKAVKDEIASQQNLKAPARPAFKERDNTFSGDLIDNSLLVQQAKEWESAPISKHQTEEKMRQDHNRSTQADRDDRRSGKTDLHEIYIRRTRESSKQLRVDALRACLEESARDREKSTARP